MSNRKMDIYSMEKKELEQVIRECQEKIGVKPKISYPTDILSHISFRDADQEHFAVAYLDSAHQIIEVKITSIGTLNRCLATPRDVFKHALTLQCKAIILIHNHPSGSVNPSPEDISITNIMVKAGEILGIGVLDHVIVSATNYHSFCEKSEMPKDSKDTFAFKYKRRKKGSSYSFSVHLYQISGELIHTYHDIQIEGDVDFNVKQELLNRLTDKGYENIVLYDLNEL